MLAHLEPYEIIRLLIKDQDLSGSRYLGTSAKYGFKSYWPGPGVSPFDCFSRESLPKVTLPECLLAISLSYDPGPGTLLLSIKKVA